MATIRRNVAADSTTGKLEPLATFPEASYRHDALIARRGSAPEHTADKPAMANARSGSRAPSQMAWSAQVTCSTSCPAWSLILLTPPQPPRSVRSSFALLSPVLPSLPDGLWPTFPAAGPRPFLNQTRQGRCGRSSWRQSFGTCTPIRSGHELLNRPSRLQTSRTLLERT